MDKKTELEITPGKEEKIMEEKIKELEAKVALLEADVKAKNVEIAELSAANTKLDKELILERAKVQKEKDSAEAEAIAIAALATSSIPQNLHTKVRGLVNYADFKKEDGTFDKDAYAAAFKAEVAEWEGSFTKSTTVVLTDDTKIDSIGSESADDDVEYGKKLAKEFAGHIRSEE